MSLLEWFCDVDLVAGFALHRTPEASRLREGSQRARAGQICPSEVMTILIHFHQSHYRTFKAYDTEHVQVHLAKEFPHLVSDQRFVALIPFRAGSYAHFLAEPIWSLHGHQLHRLDFDAASVTQNGEVDTASLLRMRQRGKTSMGWLTGRD
jgi:hypothetical protein